MHGLGAGELLLQDNGPIFVDLEENDTEADMGAVVARIDPKGVELALEDKIRREPAAGGDHRTEKPACLELSAQALLKRLRRRHEPLFIKTLFDASVLMHNHQPATRKARSGYYGSHQQHRAGVDRHVRFGSLQAKRPLPPSKVRPFGDQASAASQRQRRKEHGPTEHQGWLGLRGGGAPNRTWPGLSRSISEVSRKFAAAARISRRAGAKSCSISEAEASARCAARESAAIRPGRRSAATERRDAASAVLARIAFVCGPCANPLTDAALA